MKSQSPALTKAALVSAAGRKAHKVQEKLNEAESKLHMANTMLKATPTRARKELDAALEQNVSAEEKVREAAEELEVVKELLSDANGSTTSQKSGPASGGQTGHGLKSLMPHLVPRATAAE